MLGRFDFVTRMHSSGMRTTRLLTVSQHVLGKGVCIPACTGQGGVCLLRGCLVWREVSAQGGVCPGSVCPGGDRRGVADADSPLWTDRHLCKHNLRKLRLRAVKLKNLAVQYAYDNSFNRFDQAMVAFLDCLQQFKEEVEKGDSGFCLPYRMEKGKIEDSSSGTSYSIK